MTGTMPRRNKQGMTETNAETCVSCGSTALGNHQWAGGRPCPNDPSGAFNTGHDLTNGLNWSYTGQMDTEGNVIGLQCDSCGSLVGDQQQHTQWHIKIAKALYELQERTGYDWEPKPLDPAPQVPYPLRMNIQ